NQIRIPLRSGTPAAERSATAQSPATTPNDAARTSVASAAVAGSTRQAASATDRHRAASVSAKQAATSTTAAAGSRRAARRGGWTGWLLDNWRTLLVGCRLRRGGGRPSRAPAGRGRPPNPVAP